MFKLGYIFLPLFLIFLSSCATINPAQNKKESLIYYEMGRNIIYHKDIKALPQAFAYLEHAKKLDPSNPRIYYMTGMAYRLRGEKEKAKNYFLQAIEKDKEFGDAYNALGISYAENNEFEKAIQCFTRLINNPAYPHPDLAYYNRASVYMKLKDWKKAEEDLEDAIVFSNEGNKDYLWSLSSLYISKKDYWKALIMMNKITAKFSMTDDIKYYKGWCYIQLSLKERAKNILSSIDKKSPFYKRACELLKNK